MFISSSTRKSATELLLLTEAGLPRFLKQETIASRKWIATNNFRAKAGSWLMLPEADGKPARVLAGVEENPSIWSLAHLPTVLPCMGCVLNLTHLGKPWQTKHAQFLAAVGWGLACYAYMPFKKDPASPVCSLVLPKGVDEKELRHLVEASFLVRDLVNAPANVMIPSELAAQARAVAEQYGAKVEVVSGDALLKRNYPCVHAVGRASVNPPCLIDFRWGKKTHPRITLVGKGVCFDSGGLDIKSGANMKLMKKDMGGAAMVLGLASMVMAAKLPVSLRVLIPAVENSVGGDAFRPLDVLNTRKGLTVEVGDTDAEGRLILCDALTEADSERPALLIDCATLTGAARVALGTDVPAFFTPSDALAKRLEEAVRTEQDPLWRLPLFAPYEEQLKSPVADLSNISTSAYGGAITAALFLKRFVEVTTDWVHVDLMAWNLAPRPGRPVGGEAMGLRALYQLVKKYASASA